MSVANRKNEYSTCVAGTNLVTWIRIVFDYAVFLILLTLVNSIFVELCIEIVDLITLYATNQMWFRVPTGLLLKTSSCL